LNIVFRTDASNEIGTGHVMRCLTLADELKKCGAKCIFVCRQYQGNLLILIINRGHKALGLPKVALSTDKASSPINLYGATKLASDKLFVASNSSYASGHETRFAVVRYGNVMGSRGSVIPFFLSQASSGSLSITDTRMTRFMITLEQGVELVWQAFDDMVGGEINVKKIPSMKVTDIATTVDPTANHEIIGIRPGEKLHEEMISTEDAAYTYEYPEHFKILPAIHEWNNDQSRINGGKAVPENFSYTSDNNSDWMTIESLSNWVKANQAKMGVF
jgi:FlaA1/EpsC-like NDP-sugar epimerase